MLLSVKERLLLLNILPERSDYTTLKIVRRLREDLSFSEEEHKAFGIKVDGGRVEWDSEAESDKEIAVGEKALDIIVAGLKDADRRKQLTEDMLPIYERLILSDGV